MRVLSLVTLLCQGAARLLSFAVSVYGLLPFASADFRQDAAVMILYCVLPVLSFPVTLLFSRSLRWSVALHWILALGYLTAYSLLDWRTCAELGYCQGVLSTVFATLTGRRVQGVFAVAVLNLALLFLRRYLRSAQVESNGIRSAS